MTDTNAKKKLKSDTTDSKLANAMAESRIIAATRDHILNDLGADDVSAAGFGLDFTLKVQL